MEVTSILYPSTPNKKVVICMQVFKSRNYVIDENQTCLEQSHLFVTECLLLRNGGTVLPCAVIVVSDPETLLKLLCKCKVVVYGL